MNAPQTPPGAADGAAAPAATGRRVIGRRLPRLDAIGKVTGATTYAADFALPGMLHGRVLRSTVAHGRIRRLDVRAAAALPGVRVVLTAADIAPTRYGLAVADRPVLATDVVRFVGEPVVALAADTAEIAEQALRRIEVDYEPLPAVFDLEAAAEPDTPLVHPDWQHYKAMPILDRQGNVTGRSSIVTGDVAAAFRQAWRVYEHRFQTQYVHPGYTEPRNAVASWDASGRVTVWTSTQLPFDTQYALAEILDLPASRVRVVVPGIGGGFGGKLRIGVEHFAAWLARKSGRPVRVMDSCEEELTDAYPRQPSVTVLRTAVDRDGNLLAREGRILLDCGAYTNSGPGTAAVALQVLAGPYRCPNLSLTGLAVYTNKGPTGSFRGPAGPMANFAVESQMDMIADDLGIDPLAFRLRNCYREGDRGPAGERLAAVSIETCLRRAAAAIGWDERRPGSGRGKGIACSWWMTTGGSSGVYVRLQPDGQVVLVSGAVEIGTGALTGASQVLAEELAIDLADVHVAGIDTQNCPFDYGAQGSRTTFSVGNACRAAAADLRRQIFERVAAAWQVDPAELRLQDKAVVHGDRRMTLAEVGAAAQRAGGGLLAQGTAISPAPAHDPSTVRHHPLPVWNTPSFHAHAAEVAVDRDSGEVTIERYVVAQDVGFAINPTYIEGQIEGGVAQGIGQTLSEEIVYRDGRVLNANLTDYKMPTFADMPRVETILVECASAAGPFGAKGVGEPPCIEPPAAIANAIASAVGVRIQRLPITAERIGAALSGGPAR